MACSSRRLLRLLSVCPICFDQTGALTAGVSAGGAVLVIALVVILGAFGRFAWRLTQAGDRSADADHRPRGLS